MTLTRIERGILYILAAVWIILIATFICVGGVKILVQTPIQLIHASEIVCDEDLDKMEEYSEQLELVPKEIVQSFLANNWTFDIVSQEEFVRPENSDNYARSGAADYSNKSIWVSRPESVVHEFGHYLDYTLGFPDKHAELYDSESEAMLKILGPHSKSNSREYFASYFSYWLQNQDNADVMNDLQKTSPETYDYFNMLSQSNWNLNTNKIVVQFPSLKGFFK